MLRNTIAVVALGFSLSLGLTGCAPPAEEPKAEESSAALTPAPNVAPTTAPVEREPASAPKPRPSPKPRPVEVEVDETPAAAPVCQDCGIVASVAPVKSKGSGSGAGAVIGAIAGGVIGHQFGGGKGKDVATAAGAIGGGVAGHEVEKRVRGTTNYQVGVNMENGTYRTVTVVDAAGISTGTRVRVVGENLQIR